MGSVLSKHVYVLMACDEVTKNDVKYTGKLRMLQSGRLRPLCLRKPNDFKKRNF